MQNTYKNLNFKIIMPCHFGLESVAKRELINLGYQINSVVDGEVAVVGNLDDVIKLNLCLRTCERVMIEIGEFKATTFEELYQNTRNLKFEDFVGVNDAFNISKANQDKFSTLHSSTSIQSIVKKAIVDRLMEIYNTNYLPEKNNKYNFRVKFYKNICSIRLDTTGESLHKRGYRKTAGIAPIEETLAAAIIYLTPYKKGRILLDPFCGSGTFLIEAAMMAANIYPGINRNFYSESWSQFEKNEWNNKKEYYKKLIDYNYIENNEIKLYGYDYDKNMIDICLKNARIANVEKLIQFEQKEVNELYNNEKYGFIITNPPYGERISDIDIVNKAYDGLSKLYKRLDSWSMYVISSNEKIKKYLGKKNKNRKLYNGMIKTYLYSYIGEYKK